MFIILSGDYNFVKQSSPVYSSYGYSPSASTSYLTAPSSRSVSTSLPSPPAYHSSKDSYSTSYSNLNQRLSKQAPLSSYGLITKSNLAPPGSRSPPSSASIQANFSKDLQSSSYGSTPDFSNQTSDFSFVNNSSRREQLSSTPQPRLVSMSYSQTSPPTPTRDLQSSIPSYANIDFMSSYSSQGLDKESYSGQHVAKTKSQQNSPPTPTRELKSSPYENIDFLKQDAINLTPSRPSSTLPVQQQQPSPPTKELQHNPYANIDPRFSYIHNSSMSSHNFPPSPASSPPVTFTTSQPSSPPLQTTMLQSSSYTSMDPSTQLTSSSNQNLPPPPARSPPANFPSPPSLPSPPTRDLQTSSITNTFLRGILSSIDSKDPIVANAWLETILDAIDLLPQDVIKREVVLIAVTKAQGEQTHSSKKSACRLLGKISCKLDAQSIKAEILPAIMTLFRDPEGAVRHCMCQQMHYVARGLGSEDAESLLLPQLLHLSDDENAKVRLASMEAVVQMLGYLKSQTCTNTVVPLVVKICERAKKVSS